MGSPTRLQSSPAAVGQMRQTLVSPETTALLGALDLASKDQSLPQESRQAANRPRLRAAAPTMVAGSRPQPQLASLDEVKPETFEALRDTGVEIDRGGWPGPKVPGSNAKHGAALIGLCRTTPR